MEQNENQIEYSHEHKHCHCKESCFKYALIFFATILGAFLAFYFVADYTFKMMFSPDYQMRRAEKMMRNMDRNIEKELNRDFGKEITVVGRMMQSPVELTENSNSYIVKIALKPFGNNSKNIKLTTESNNTLKIEGSNEVKKGNNENLMSMMQSYKFQKPVDFNKMTKKEERGNYVITIPFTAE